MNILKYLILSSLSGLLLAYSWPEIGYWPLIFIAWMPLLYVSERMIQQGTRLQVLKAFGFAYISFLVWNFISTWWIRYASYEGALMAILANAFLMACCFSIYQRMRMRFPDEKYLWLLVVFWMGFEYLHLNWDLSWPWLMLGNVFALQHEIIQWYEFTGAFGGTLWILAVNIILFRIYLNKKRNLVKALKTLGLLIILPIALSLLLYSWAGTEKQDPLEAVIVQPNIDPYSTKFDFATIEQQTQIFFQLAESKITESTSYVIGPETAIPRSLRENDLLQEKEMEVLLNFTERYPNINLLSGIASHKVHLPPGTKTITARKFRDADIWYDEFNTALHLNKNGYELYHKSKLVPGPEMLPFPWLFGTLNELALDLGGTTGQLGTQKERTVFKGLMEEHRPAPSICYESVYGGFMREFVVNGANFIAIITNDGWWEKTAGHRQHLAYAKLRAIETRRSIVRSANTGISAEINQRGDIVQYLPYGDAGAIRATINLNNSKTLYVITGDILAIAASIIALVLMMYFPLKRIMRKLILPSSKVQNKSDIWGTKE
jgi:apolipoprotein N-acyltransferase